MGLPVLWQFTYSHFNEKARWALDFKGVRHVRHSLLPGPHLLKVKRMTGQSAVPVLNLNGATIFDSSRIIEVLERSYPAPALYPADPAGRERALELEDFFDEELGPYYRRWFFHTILDYPDYVANLFACDSSVAVRITYRAAFPALVPILKRAMDITPATAETARQKTIAALDRIERELQPSGYLVGDRFTVADLTAAALCSPMVMPPEFPYHSAAPPPEAVAKMQAALSERPALQWVAQVYRRHRGTSAAVAA
jgi:glutathione S-transferase